jgi:hypothetical protein
MQRIAISIVGLSLFLFSITSCKNNENKNDEAIELNLNYVKGEEHILIYEMETASNPMMKYESKSEISFKADSISNTAITFETHLLKTKTKMVMGEDVDGYDSEKKVSEMTVAELEYHNLYKESLNNPLYVMLDRKGKVLKPAHFKDGRISNNNEVDLKYIFLNFPTEKVNVGSEWAKEDINEFKVKMNFKYKIEKITPDKIIISVKVSMNGVGGMINNDGSGEVVLDKKSCRVIEAKIAMGLNENGSVKINIHEKK